MVRAILHKSRREGDTPPAPHTPSHQPLQRRARLLLRLLPRPPLLLTQLQPLKPQRPKRLKPKSQRLRQRLISQLRPQRPKSLRLKSLRLRQRPRSQLRPQRLKSLRPMSQRLKSLRLRPWPRPKSLLMSLSQRLRSASAALKSRAPIKELRLMPKLTMWRCLNDFRL